MKEEIDEEKSIKPVKSLWRKRVDLFEMASRSPWEVASWGTLLFEIIVYSTKCLKILKTTFLAYTLLDPICISYIMNRSSFSIWGNESLHKHPHTNGARDATLIPQVYENDDNNEGIIIIIVHICDHQTQLLPLQFQWKDDADRISWWYARWRTDGNQDT